MDKIEFVDQSIRDAQQSLWGFRMPTDMITPIAPVMDQVGYKAIGVVGGRGAVVAIQYLRENIFERFRLLSQLMPRTPLRSSFVAWATFGFNVEPIAANELWIRRAVANGVKSFWVCDYQNMMDRLSYLVKVAKKEGAQVVGGLMYALSPVHTDELFAQKTRKLAELEGVDLIQLEDASGVLTPERTRTLLPAIVAASKGKPVELHVHCNTGLASQCYVEAMKLGIKNLHTAVSPLANDTSLPSAENTIENARRLGYSPNLDEEALKTVSDHFKKMAQERGMRIGVPLEYNIQNFEHQIPGGMMGTLRNQLAEVKQEHRLDEVLEEVARVREDLGYPVMATPYSQIVGVQALFNVIGGRYKVISDEVIMYVLENFGETDGPVNQNVKDKILGSAKAKKLVNWKPAEITIEDLRRLEPGLSDDDLLLRIANPDAEFKNKLDALYGGK
ncbi:MAG: pyruvate carboxylase [Dethiobacter sp.]|jgi:oxaloacetate decarboxylase alpha subunit|nr:MAG: pyruvate carboxylase [Dethiobacter sp.]